jgi:hypothetical protein
MCSEVTAGQQSSSRPGVRWGAAGDRRVCEMVVEARQLHGPRELSGRPGSVGDPAHVLVIRLAAAMCQELERPEFDPRDAVASQLRGRHGGELEHLVQQCGRSSPRRDRRGDPLDVVDHWLAKATVLPGVIRPGQHSRSGQFQRPSVGGFLAIMDTVAAQVKRGRERSALMLAGIVAAGEKPGEPFAPNHPGDWEPVR